MRVLYVLNAIGGGASAGIYEFLRAQPDLTAYAVVPPGDITPIRDLFADVQTVPLPWWNRRVGLDPLRRTAIQLGAWRRGQTDTASTRAIADRIRAWDIDIVHTGTALTRGGALAAWQTGRPHIWHIKETIGTPNRVQFPLPDDALVGYISALSRRVVVMSDYIGAIFRQHNIPNLSVIPDGVDPRPYETATARDLRARLGLRDDQALVGMVAGLSSTWKQHDLFVQMAGQLAIRCPDVTFAIIGGSPTRHRFPYDAPYRYAESIRRLVRAHVPPGRLHLLDHVPNPPDIMRSLDVLVHPCATEPFGRVAIEAMAAGTPVVGPASGGIAETVMHEATGLLVAPNDAAALTRAVAVLLDDPDRRVQLGAAGRQRVAAHYEITTFSERLLGLYTKIIGSGRAIASNSATGS